MIRSIKQVELESRRVVLRVDLDCPVRGGAVVDDTRIRAAVPTIRHAMNQRAKLVILSHLGRPDGAGPDPRFSLEPVGAELARLLDAEVVLADDCVGDGVRKVVSDLYGGRIAMLENVLFHPGEEANDEKFARELALLGDVYVNDAFSVSHRASASVSVLPRLVKERCAGLQMGREMGALGVLRGDPKRPFVAVVGGAGVRQKLGIVRELMQRADSLLLGGAVASTFLAARGLEMGDSIVDRECLVHARGAMDEARRGSVRLVLPADLAVSGPPGGAAGAVVGAAGVARGTAAMDIGPATVAAFAAEIGKAGTVFWNGPMGVCEDPPHDAGTVAIAEAVSRSMAYSVVSGDDTIAAIRKRKLDLRFDHVSTGGTASLAFVEGREMPGVAALEVEE